MLFQISATYTWFIHTYVLLRALTFLIIQEHGMFPDNAKCKWASSEEVCPTYKGPEPKSANNQSVSRQWEV